MYTVPSAYQGTEPILSIHRMFAECGILNEKQIQWVTQGGFPGGAVVKNLPANEGDTGSSPGPGRSHMPQSKINK